MQVSDSSQDAAKPADSPRPAPRLSIAHLLLFTLTTAISIAILSFDNREPGDEDEPQTPAAHVVKVSAQAWFAAVLGAQLASSAIVLPWMLRSTALPAPGHWLLVGLGGEALAMLALVGTFAALGGDGDSPMIFGESLHHTLFRTYAGLQLALALLWLAISIKTWRSRWTLLVYLPELALALIRAYGLFLIASLSVETLIITTMSSASAALLMLHIGNAGTPLVGVVVVVLGLIDRRYHQRDWLHTLGIFLMGLRLINFSLEWAQSS